MIRVWMACLVVLASAFAGVAETETDAPYDLLFRNGTLDAVDRDSELIYRRVVTNSLRPETEQRDTGDIAITFADEGMARLELRQASRERALGRFPANVGNPMIMMFYESVIRDMAESAGGSPFYIRNRVKEALIRPAEVEAGETEVDGRNVPTQIVHLRPFADDPNKARMQGFGDLVLTVTMSEAVPGWYVSLVADAGVYRSETSFDRMEQPE